ncbi:MAG: threonylcarbamoyl-AMP synthase [Phycisphaera sp.]|nr:MAG: threonylcarbamoyl-AMP synthase [Phycisphaera sp.]
MTSDIQLAADKLSRGGLVAFPTETVYGLGADALDEDAVRRVFALKGRPANNPLIVHVSSIEMAKSLVCNWSKTASLIASRFWPGPLTMVLPKSDRVPGVVTGGGDTVAIRMPDHEIARSLIESFGGPLVGPSANRSGTISPTTAEHVEASLGPDTLVLDAGPCQRGIESTVIRITEAGAEILRPGVTGTNEIEEIISIVQSDHEPPANAPLPSPGMLTKHYAPSSETRLVDDLGEIPGEAVVVCISEPPAGSRAIRMPSDASGYAARLYAALREADAFAPEIILIERPAGKGPIWDAVRDRLRRASAQN